MAIYPTKLYQEGNDPNYEKFIQVYNMVFPISIEEKYVNLVNAVYDYWKNSSALTSSDIEIRETSDKIGELTDELKQKLDKKNQYTAELDSIKRQMIESIESGNYDILKKLAERAEYLSNSLKFLGEITQTKIDSNRDFITDKHVIANEARKGLNNSIHRIQEIMSEIYNLPNGGISRIDNFEITQKHLDLINSLECPAEVKQIFSQKLISQFKFRVEAFKCFEKYALLIIEQYKNRDLSYHIDYDIQKKVEIAAKGLEEYELTDNVFSVFKDWTNLPTNALNDEFLKSLRADMVADFLKNGTIEQEKIDQFEKFGKNMEGHTLQLALLNNKVEHTVYK